MSSTIHGQLVNANHDSLYNQMLVLVFHKMSKWRIIL